MIQLDLRSSQPLYEQITAQYKYMMLQGYLSKGDAIPSVRKLAIQLNITPGTVSKAYRELERQGLIETIRGKGTYIAGIPSGDSVRNEEKIMRVKEELKEQIMELVYQGLDGEEIVRLVEEILRGLKGGKNV